MFGGRSRYTTGRLLHELLVRRVRPHRPCGADSGLGLGIVRSASVKKLALLLPAFEQRPHVLPGRLEAQIVEVSAVAARASELDPNAELGPECPGSEATRERCGTSARL